MADIVSFVSSAVLAVTFLWSASYKFARPAAWREALDVYGLGGTPAGVVWIFVPLAEAGVVALLIGGRAAPGGALALGLLASFCAGLLRARSREGDRLPCGCFGGRERRDYRLLLVRNVALLVPAVWLMTMGPGRNPGAPPPEEAIPAALVVVGLIAIGWIATQAFGAMRQRGDR